MSKFNEKVQLVFVGYIEDMNGISNVPLFYSTKSGGVEYIRKDSFIEMHKIASKDMIAIRSDATKNIRRIYEKYKNGYGKSDEALPLSVSHEIWKAIEAEIIE